MGRVNDVISFGVMATPALPLSLTAALSAGRSEGILFYARSPITITPDLLRAATTTRLRSKPPSNCLVLLPQQTKTEYNTNHFPPSCRHYEAALGVLRQTTFIAVLAS